MKLLTIGLTVFLVATGLGLIGCGQSASSAGSGKTNSNSAKSDSGQSHSNANKHTHGHKLGAPLYGGKVVAIGHTHHSSGETHYSAELMPVIDGKITFHVLTIDSAGKSQTVRVQAEKIVAYVDPLDSEIVREVTFKASGNSGSTFVATIPESIQDCKEFSVVVPKIELGGERLNFSFKTSTKPSPDKSQKAKGTSK